MTWNCDNCGAQLEEGVKFCPNCGTSINWEQSWTEGSFTCGNCGGEFHGKVDFCPHCGTKVNWETNDNQDESSKSNNLYGMAFIAICACIAMGIYIYLGNDWFFIIFMTVCTILVGLGFIGYAEEQNIPKKTALSITCFIGFVSLGLAFNKLSDYWDLQKEIEQRKQETEQKAKEQKEKSEQQEVKKEQATEVDREANERQEKINKIANAAYKKGWDERMERTDFLDPNTLAEIAYMNRYGADPKQSSEEERWGIFKENYIKGYEAAWEELQRRMHSEDL